MKPRRALFLCLLLVFGCTEEAPTAPSRRAAAPRQKRDPSLAKTGFEKYRTAGDADRVVIFDILISFRGAAPKIKATRSKAEAEALANEVLRDIVSEKMTFKERTVRFKELAEIHSDHRHPATGRLTYAYTLTNYGVKPKPVGEYAREQLHTGWGDVAFGLRLGGVVVAAHSMRVSAVNGRPMLPDGWHVMFRVK